MKELTKQGNKAANQRLLLAETLALINNNNQAIARLIDALMDAEESAPVPPSKKEFLNITEVADYTGFSTKHIYRLVETGALSCYKPGGQRLFFKAIDIDTFLSRNKRTASAELRKRATDILNKEGA